MLKSDSSHLTLHPSMQCLLVITLKACEDGFGVLAQHRTLCGGHVPLKKGYDKRRRKTWGRGEGWGDLKVENKYDFCCCWKEAMSFCLVKLVWQPVPEGWSSGLTLPLNIFCFCSHEIQRHSVCIRKRSRENRVDCIGKLVPVDTGVVLYPQPFKFNLSLSPWFGTKSVPVCQSSYSYWQSEKYQ